MHKSTGHGMVMLLRILSGLGVGAVLLAFTPSPAAAAGVVGTFPVTAAQVSPDEPSHLVFPIQLADGVKRNQVREPKLVMVAKDGEQRTADFEAITAVWVPELPG